MIILGIDPGSQVAGYGIIQADGRTISLVSSGAIRLQKYKELTARLSALYTEVTQLIRVHRPSQFAIEDIFVSKNIRSALTLGHARGTCILAALHGGLDVFEYSAKEVKLAVVGNGAAGKNQVAFMTKKLLSLGTNGTLDETDALAVAICHAHRLGSSKRSVRSWKDYITQHPEKVKNRPT